MFPAQTALALEHRGIKITWDPSLSPDTIGYQVWMAEDEATPQFKQISPTMTGTKFYTRELPIGRNYHFMIRAIDTHDNFGDSPVFTIFLP